MNRKVINKILTISFIGGGGFFAGGLIERRRCSHNNVRDSKLYCQLGNEVRFCLLFCCYIYYFQL